MARITVRRNLKTTFPETPTAPQCRAAEKMTSDSLLTAGSVKNFCFISLAT